MLVSRRWLQKFFDLELPPAEKLAEGLTFHAFEVDGIERKNEDEVLDVKVTPNRGHDALSHRGIAKELSTILAIALDHDPFRENPDLSPTTDAVLVTLEDPSQSPRYIAGYIKNVKVGPSPQWLVRNLEAINQRSINNVVDATNFVMFNLGQPLHAFDASKLTQKDAKFHIVVRKARMGEKLHALDEKEYELAERMLVIADGNADVPIGIAGVKGGMPASITPETKDIILESANFSGVSVRKTAQALRLRTDASTRFEQVLSPHVAAYGMRAAADLITKIAGGEIVGFADVYPEPPKERSVSVSLTHIHRVLGTKFSNSDVSGALARLGCAFTEQDDAFEVKIPHERLDLAIPEDLVEEVGRIIGYEKILPVSLPPFPHIPEVNKNFYAAEKMRENLVSRGYSEVLTSVFRDTGERAVLNKVDSVRPYLRSSLLDGLTEALEKNKHFKDLLGLEEIKLFEIGSVWRGGKEILMVGSVTEKEKATEIPLEGAASETYANLPLSKTRRYQPFSRYPYIVRDIAVWVSGNTTPEPVLETVKSGAGALAVRVSLFDRFEKEGRVSLAFRIVFQSFEKTLTEAEANEIMEKISAALKAQGFEVR